MPTAITLIPDDVLVDVFRRVASPRGLAACRCVCRAWRALIDDRRLLRADLLPLSLAGLLLCLNAEGEPPDLFARPGADVTGYGLHLMPHPNISIDGHCNGLILIYDKVLNPATGRVVRLPVCPPSPLLGDHPRCFNQDCHLAFDPAESPHYQVFCIPRVLTHKAEPACRAIFHCEWPPSPFVLNIFSSITGRWESRSLVRQGGAAGTVGDMDVLSTDEHLHSACWRGALYVHCQNGFVLRIPLSEHTTTYQVIKPPREVAECRGDPIGRLGRSEKGVYFASFDLESHLCVWILHDSSSCGHMEWILRHRSPYGLAPPNSSPRSSWTLHNAIRSEDGSADALEWDSDDDDLHTETQDRIQERLADFGILALHPYREIVFMFVEQCSREVAYAHHLKSSRLDDLGNAFPKGGVSTPGAGAFSWMENSFPYTPCWMGVP